MNNQRDHILLIEDNRDDIELISIALREFINEDSIKVIRNGADALDYLFCTHAYANRDKNNQPYLILLDIKLPKLDGIEVLKRVKEDSDIRKIPVVILTSSRQSDDIKSCLDLGANSYVVKPVNATEFGDVLQKIGEFWLQVNEKFV